MIASTRRLNHSELRDLSGRQASSSLIIQSDVSPIKSINGKDYLLPEIGLNKFRDQQLNPESELNPFKVSKNPEKLLALNEREREKSRLLILKKKLQQDES
ncbi:UNKNOWN [Stylonychia lemnae]|uniref:Uncharacterized protein n=1 Tax=Stylonychia lemnae TaxID=5949 RepID=A0A078AY30_STYLE|nr:UNKNOWN [Stylonychia lemnae]|eukprot:CDW87074.1 UNKNOWN [Stylonychia lemnae]